MVHRLSGRKAASPHLVDYVAQRGAPKQAHQIDADDFVRHLRQKRVASNGHPHTRKRPLQDKTARFVLETCRSIYGFAAKKRHLPPSADNPFTGLGGKRRYLEDAKSIYVFDAGSELRFLQEADDWSFAIHITLAKTGLLPGELMHLLIEDVDLLEGWLHVRNKPELGWHIKSRRDRSVPKVHHTELYPGSLLGGLRTCSRCGARMWQLKAKNRAYLACGCFCLAIRG